MPQREDISPATFYSGPREHHKVVCLPIARLSGNVSLLMEEGGPLVRHVSDTARWIAAVRAEETARPDALFKDPLAAKLAGDRGHAIAAAMFPERWPFITRTLHLD